MGNDSSSNTRVRTKGDFACRRHHHQAAASPTLQNRDATKTFVLHRGSKLDAQRWCLECRHAEARTLASRPHNQDQGARRLRSLSDMKSTCACCAYSRHVLFLSNLGETCTLPPGGRLTLEHRLSRAHYSPWRSETKTTCLRGISAAPVHELHAHGGILAVLHPGRDVKPLLSRHFVAKSHAVPDTATEP